MESGCRRGRDDRAAPHAGPRVRPDPAEHDDRPRQHAQAGGLAGAPRHGDQPAPQAGAGLRAGVAVDDDLAATHALAAELAPRRAADHERAAVHPRSGVVAGVALDVQLAAAHAGPACAPTLPATVRRPAVMPAPTYLTRLRSPSRRTSSPLPVTSKNSPTRVRSLPCRAAAPRRRPRAVRRQNLGLQRHVGLLAQRQRERHGTRSAEVEVVAAKLAAVVAGRDLTRLAPASAAAWRPARMEALTGSAPGRR